jgi:hypothetical protein
MKERCLNPNNKDFPSYGGRGITVCPEWQKSYLSFLEHVGRRPSSAHSIDRLDNEKGYEPGNVRWSTSGEQARNTRRNRMITFQGRTRCLTDWAEEIQVDPRVLWSRLDRGWTVERALTQPKRLFREERER